MTTSRRSSHTYAGYDDAGADVRSWLSRRSSSVATVSLPPPAPLTSVGVIASAAPTKTAALGATRHHRHPTAAAHTCASTPAPAPASAPAPAHARKRRHFQMIADMVDTAHAVNTAATPPVARAKLMFKLIDATIRNRTHVPPSPQSTTRSQYPLQPPRRPPPPPSFIPVVTTVSSAAAATAAVIRTPHAAIGNGNKKDTAVWNDPLFATWLDDDDDDGGGGGGGDGEDAAAELGRKLPGGGGGGSHNNLATSDLMIVPKSTVKPSVLHAHARLRERDRHLAGVAWMDQSRHLPSPVPSFAWMMQLRPWLFAMSQNEGRRIGQRLLILCGPSGSGKTVCVHQYIAAHLGLDVCVIDPERSIVSQMQDEIVPRVKRGEKLLLHIDDFPIALTTLDYQFLFTQYIIKTADSNFRWCSDVTLPILVVECQASEWGRHYFRTLHQWKREDASVRVVYSRAVSPREICRATQNYALVASVAERAALDCGGDLRQFWVRYHMLDLLTHQHTPVPIPIRSSRLHIAEDLSSTLEQMWVAQIRLSRTWIDAWIERERDPSTLGYRLIDLAVSSSFPTVRWGIWRPAQKHDCFTIRAWYQKRKTQSTKALAASTAPAPASADSRPVGSNGGAAATDIRVDNNHNNNNNNHKSVRWTEAAGVESRRCGISLRAGTPMECRRPTVASRTKDETQTAAAERERRKNRSDRSFTAWIIRCVGEMLIALDLWVETDGYQLMDDHDGTQTSGAMFTWTTTLAAVRSLQTLRRHGYGMQQDFSRPLVARRMHALVPVLQRFLRRK